MGQTKIVKELRERHFSVQVLSMIGDDFPDLLIAQMGFAALVELKSRASKSTWRKLSEGQLTFSREWRGAVILGFTAEQIAHDFKLYRLAYIQGLSV